MVCLRGWGLPPLVCTPRGPCGDPWAGSCLLAVSHKTHLKKMGVFKEKKKQNNNNPKPPQHLHICGMLEYGVITTSWLLHNSAWAGQWPLQPCLTCSACSCCALLSATPHTPPSGFRSVKFLINHNFPTRRFCQLFTTSHPCYCRSKPRCSTLQHSPSTAANLLLDSLSQELPLVSTSKLSLLIAPSETPTGNFHHLGLCLQLSLVCPSCSKPSWSLTCFGCLP